MRKVVLIILCLLVLVAGVWRFWPSGNLLSERQKPSALVGSNAVSATAAPAAPKKFTTLTTTNPLAYRLANTTKSLTQLAGTRHAILLQNALIDTEARLDLKIPAHLRATGNPGAFIVQARKPVDGHFRAALAAAGAEVVSYIPNNAYLVRATAGAAGLLAGNPLVQAVLPYEPYYKLQPSLLSLAVAQGALPPGTALNLGLFATDATAEKQVVRSGAKIIGRDRSAFGPVLRVLAPADWTALAQLPGVQVLEPARSRAVANDLSRVTLGVAADTVTTTNYLGLDGHNVKVVVNDTGIDATHPDFATARVLGAAGNLVDTNGHGTHVAGIIAGNGSKSLAPVNVGSVAEGSITNADFRGKAPLATLFAMNFNQSDYVLQTNAALQGALICNNSWDNGNPLYDLSASSYDAATRDALPGTTGSQPVLFVFAAGNNGGGDDYGAGGTEDTILSPGTAKNVITVGALEQLRNITNIVTTIVDGVTNQGAYWLPKTDSPSQVADYSSRGNVGVGTEGNFGRFKPDVVTPGSFVVSTRSSQWDTNVYFNPTNVFVIPYPGQFVTTNGLNYYNVTVPANAVGVVITLTANARSHTFPPDLPIYAQQSGYPDPVNAPGSIDITTTKDGLSIPPDSGGAITGIQALQNNGFDFAVGNSTNVSVDYDMTVAIYTTNAATSDYYEVLLGMDNQLGPYYRYESGTSMAAAAVSGVLALMQDYFTNSLHLSPSPALLKAMLINGSRVESGYPIALTNALNFQGWGLINLTNSLPLTSSNLNVLPNGTSPSPIFFVDQSPANALATGDRHTYIVNVATNANYLPLKATLVWTDPPGDPAAAIKLVNGLTLIITNLATGDVYYGNDIAQNLGYNLPSNTNGIPNLDTINNVQNILLPPSLSGSYSVTVLGRAVNVNAVTAHTNNVVQDFALVVSVGEGEMSAAISSVTDSGLVSNPTGDQLVTFVTTTNSPLFNQFVGANTPLLGTNNLPIGTNTIWGSNAVVTIGMTNQWHFYVATNTGTAADFTNAAFIVFSSATLSLPRMGALQNTLANATRPEADIDLYVSMDSSLTNLNPAVIANCLAGSPNSGASLTRGGTEFVTFNNSAPGEVYYVGVKSEDQMASEYAFLPIFTSTPFSSIDNNGNQIVNAMTLPVTIPDGDNAHPGLTNVFALAIYPMQMAKVTVTNLNEHENFGDLFGALSFGTTYTVLNNHDGFGNTFGSLPLVYDDSRNPIAGTVHSDGPGSLVDFRGKSTPGLWILSEMDNALTQTGRVSQLGLVIQPHRDLTQPGVRVTVPAGGWFIDYVDVGAGYTNLTFYATNLPPTAVPPIQMYEKLGSDPTLADYDQRADLTNGVPPGNAISVGPPLDMGRYFVGLYNPSASDASVFLKATLGLGSSAATSFIYTTNPATALLDDAVTDTTMFVATTQLVASVNVGLVVNHPRISDLTFTLVSPDGQRVLLMENRGGVSTNIGHLNITTNFFGSTSAGAAQASTNIIGPVQTSGVLLIDYNFYTVPDNMDVFYDGVNIFHSGYVSFSGRFSIPYGPGLSTNIVIIMNQGNNPQTTRWDYVPTVVSESYNYLTFSDDTNLATVPIKFGIPPFDVQDPGTNFSFSDFETATNGDYFGPTNIFDAYGSWTVPTNLVTVSTQFNPVSGFFELVTNVTLLTNNLVSVVADPFTAQAGSNYLALGNGTITRTLPFTVNRKYQVAYSYRGPGIAGWWRGEGDATDSSNPETNGNNGTLVGRFNFPAGQVGQAFQMEDPGDQFRFAGTNTYVQIPQSAGLDVGTGGGFTIEGWINPTNVVRPQPLVEWLAHVPANRAVTNIVILAGPYLDRATDHYYYLLGATNWTISELWATQLGGHLATVNTANEQNWIYDNFANYGGANRNLWIGLTNNLGTRFGWSSGLTNITYTNWLAGQPLNNNATLRNYTFIRGDTNLPSGLWVCANNNGFTQTAPAVTNLVYGVVEVNDIQTNGVQFWISVTNSVATGTNTLVNSNGCLYANIVDTNWVSHEIFSAPGLIQTNVYQHVALTYNTNTGLAALYLNGTNVASTNLGVFVPKTDGDLLLGYDLTRSTNNFYSGKMDEMSVYRRALSLAEISTIYRVSAQATNGLTGKFDPVVTPAFGLAEARVSLGTMTNTVLALNDAWQLDGFTFTATTNSLPLQITGLQPGVLLDSFTIAEAAVGNLYYQPEQSLDTLTGISPYGNWQLQVWDNRAQAFLTNSSQIVSWELSFVLQSNAIIASTLAPLTPTAATVSPGQTVFFAVDVPDWAHYATNLLVSSDLPVDLYFNQTNPPADGVFPNYTLLTGVTSGIATPAMATNGILPAQYPLLPGQRYYLGVRNPGIHAASIVLEVDYDITALTNAVPYSSTLGTNDALRYFSFDVSSNAAAATFQLLQLNGNADLVLHRGVPLPTLTAADYSSFNPTNADENIYVLTNSAPVPLTAGRWYLGVIRRSAGPVNYTVLAKELVAPATPTIIDLTNGVPFSFTAGPGAALTNFFRFHATNQVVNIGTNTVTNTIQGLRFELYNLSGNGDLTVQTNALPLSPPFFETSQNRGRSPEIILIQTNSVLTNLVADWYLGVPNRETQPISYTIIAVIQTNSYFAAFPGAAGAGGGAVGGRFGDVYHVTTLADAGPGSLRAAVNSTTNSRTVVFDLSGTINLLSPLVITNSYLTIAGQSAPGEGITVAGNLTTVQSAHDVIIRNVRFRPGFGVAADSLQFTNVASVIADHVSASWTSNNLVSVLGSSNVTVQWSIMADSLYDTNNPHGFGSLLRYGSGALSFHHNLYADNYNASPRLGDNLSLDFVNNVVYNWGIQSGFTTTNDDWVVNTNGFTNQLNYACNYLIAGADTAFFATNHAITNIAFYGGTTNTWIFQTNNFIDSDTNRVLNGGNTQWRMFTNQYTKFERPFPLLPVPTDEAYLAYEKVLDFAGPAMRSRDAADANIVTGVRNQTGTLISTPPTSGMVAWWKAENNALDSVGTNNGTLIGGVTYSVGEVGQAFSVNGTNQYVKVPQSPALNSFGNQLTIEFWMYANSNNLMNTFQGLVTSDYYGVEISNGSGGTIGVNWYINTTAGTYLISTVNGGGMPVSRGQWHHVAGVYNGARIQLYVDGLPKGNAQAASGTILSMLTNSFVAIGSDDGRTSCGCTGRYFRGLLDEVSIYKRALSQAELQSIYNSGSAGKFASAATQPTFLDTDQDGLPDFWESTFTTNLLYTPSNNNDRDGDGYTDLEEYHNWLSGPHALTVTNTPVGVDLMQLFGKTGNLSFAATNGSNGFVYLTNVLGSVTNSGAFSNSIAVFLPTNTTPVFSGYAAFDVYVTNNDTLAYFGPVTVSVIVSAVPIATNPPLNIITLTNRVPYTNLCNTAGSDYYRYTVSSNAYSVQFELTNRTGPMTLVARYGLPLPSLSSYDYLTNLPAPPGAEVIVVDTNSAPVPLAPGDWYLAAVNVSGAPDCLSYTLKATELAFIEPPLFLYPTNTTITNILETVPFSLTCVATDLDTPPLPLNFYLVSGPPGLTVSSAGVIDWTPTEAQGSSTNLVSIAVWNTNALAINPKSYTVTNTFTIVVLESNLPPVFVLTNIPDQIVPFGNTFALTNAATDADIPVNPLTYSLLNAPTNAAINPTNGSITWAPTSADWWTTNVFITVVTDTNVWAVNTQSFSVTNSFRVIVLGPPIVPPVFLFPTNASVFTNLETVLFTNQCLATDPNTNAYWFTLVSGPAGLSVSTNGLISWVPSEAQGPSNYLVSIAVVNTNALIPPPNSYAVTNTFAIVVLESNLPPVFILTNNSYLSAAISNLFIFTNTATDADIPANPLTYRFLVAPTNATFSTNNGAYTWFPTLADQGTTNEFTTVVTDTNQWAVNTQSFSVTNTFYVVVPLLPLVAPFSATLPATALTGTGVQLNGFASPNGFPGTAWFQWGTDTNYGNLTPPVGVGNGSGVVLVTNPITGLVPGQIYHFRLAMNNGGPPVYGFDHIFGEGAVIAWGDDTFNQTNVPIGLSNVVAIASGGYHGLALKNDGTVVAWGLNSSGQTDIPLGLSNVVAVSAGAYHSLALKNDGAVAAWGDGASGQTNIPPGLSNVVMISSASSGYHNLALKNDGTIVAWGYSLNGETNVPAGLSNIVAVAGGGLHSLALKNDGTVMAWGENSYGQTNVPVGLSNVAEISGGLYHSLALQGDGAVVAWGAGSNNVYDAINWGQSLVPIGLSNVLAVGAGDWHSLSLSGVDLVTAWGAGTTNTGTPNLGQSIVPAGLSNIVAIAGGNAHSLVLQSFPPPLPVVLPVFTSVSLGTNGSGGLMLQWTAPSYESFKVQWATNLAPAVWYYFPAIITSTNGTFFFTDTNLPLLLKFYRLQLWP